MKHWLLLIFIVVFSQVVWSQTSTIEFTNPPPSSIIKLDGMIVQAYNPIEISQGEHVYEVWKDGARTQRNVFYQRPNRSTVIDLTPVIPRQDQEYRKQMAFYQSMKFGSRYIVPVASIALFAQQYGRVVDLKNQMDDHYTKALYRKQLYETATDQETVLNAKENYLHSKERYYQAVEDHRNLRNRTIVLGACLAGITAGFQVIAVKLEKPQLKETVGVTLIPNEYNNTASLGLQLNIPLR